MASETSSLTSTAPGLSWRVKLIVGLLVLLAVAVVLVSNRLLTDRYTADTRSRAEVRLALYTGNLMAELQRTSVVPLLLARDPELVRAWLHQFDAIVNFGFLGEANTYAYRHRKVSLASVLDHRFGEMRDQVHIWQAAIDEDAMVFTTHPLTPPKVTEDWNDDESPGYWTGEASMPRSAQYRRTAVHIYQPAWSEATDAVLWSVFPYRQFTHAFVPQDRFDEVRQVGNWTIVTKDGGYIALWSWRTATFKANDPGVPARTTRSHAWPPTALSRRSCGP